VRGWSEAESLDRTEASPTLCDVMADSGAEDDRVANMWAGGVITSCCSGRIGACVNADPVRLLVACAAAGRSASMPASRLDPAAAI
jgi:hypothetical protein